MAVIINLKEIFATDSQVEVSSKVNFNFNQLIALGIGGAGPTGLTGPIGPAGPIGPIGPAGPTGSVIYGTTPATAATSAPFGAPAGITIGDILITADKVLKRVSTSGSNIYGWEVLTDFNSLVQAALGTNISPYVRLGATSRVVKPRVTAGLDLTNSVTSTDPNFVIPGLGTNYQTVLYNFNELKTRSLSLVGSNIAAILNSSTEVSFNASSSSVVSLTNNQITVSAGHGLSTGQFVTYSNEGGTSIGGLTNNSGYYVYAPSLTVFSLCETYVQALAGTPVIDLTSLGALNSGAPHKFITYPASVDSIFPQTSNLSVYSFFNSTASAAKEFETDPSAKGYRGQIELGSLDTLPTAYNGITTQNFLISPSFENLRIRKYRLGGFTLSGGTTANPGDYMLRAEYDLSSSGSEVAESFSPRRNSEHRWLINKAGTSQSVGRTVEMKLTNEHILANTESAAVAAGVSVDGLFFKRNASFGGGLTANYFAIGFNPANNNSIDFDAPSGVTFNFNQNIVLGSGVTSTLKSNGIDYSGGAGATWTIAAVNGNLRLQTSNAAATISLNNAVVVRENRLAQGLPFPVTQVVSTDENTLDDYEEGTWTPVLYGGALQNQATSNPSFKQLMASTQGPASSLNGPARAFYQPPLFTSGPVYELGLYGPLGSGPNYTWRDIPIDVTYARYVKVGKKVTCWVNFAINPSFNWITTRYTGTWDSVNTLTQVFTAGTNASRCDFLYDVNKEWFGSCAIGLTLPFGAAVAPSAGSTGFSLFNPAADQLSSTVLAGTYNLQIDNNVIGIESPFGGGPSYPIVQYPAFYQNPLTVIEGVASGGGVETGGAIGLVSNMLPINPTGKSEIRIGVVNTRVTTSGPPFFDFSTSYSPAALFFGERDILGYDAFTSSGTARNAGTSRLSPVTALDCLYEAWIPAAGNVADANLFEKLIRFQCHFTYETAT
jgi:hypothetical protein